MGHLTFGEIQRRARAIGLVMSRQGMAIRLRHRNPDASEYDWTGLDAAGALRIVEALERDQDSGKGA